MQGRSACRPEGRPPAGRRCPAGLPTQVVHGVRRWPTTIPLPAQCARHGEQQRAGGGEYMPHKKCRTVAEHSKAARGGKRVCRGRRESPAGSVPYLPQVLEDTHTVRGSETQKGWAISRHASPYLNPPHARRTRPGPPASQPTSLAFSFPISLHHFLLFSLTR